MNEKKRRMLLAFCFTAMVAVLGLALRPVAAAPSNAVNEALAQMTLEQKVGQLMIGFFNGSTVTPELAERLSKLHLGGVILYNVSGNIESPQQLVQLTGELQQRMNVQGDLPLFISIDQEGGRVSRLTRGVTVFPGNMALGAGNNEDLTAAVARVMARELHILGINMNFAPVVDVNSNPANPVIGIRSFGSDPQVVARLGRAMIAPYREEQVICVAKHFPGHGDTAIDSHLGLPQALQSQTELESTALYPFRQMIEGGVPAVMTAHVVVPALDPSGLPSTLSPVVVGRLRSELGEEGVIITDSLSMGAIDQQWGMDEAAVRAMIAGADLLLFGADDKHQPQEQADVHRRLVDAVNSGQISKERLDQSLRRILQLKERYGLLRYKENGRPLTELNSAAHRTVAAQAAAQAITLLRDDSRLLPITREMKIPLLWPREYSADLTELLLRCPNLQPQLLPLNATPSMLPITLRQAPLIVAGSYNLYKNPAWRELLAALPGEKLIVLALGVPYDGTYLPQASTFLASYGSQPVSVAALAEVLNGRMLPSGRLPVILPAAGK